MLTWTRKRSDIAGIFPAADRLPILQARVLRVGAGAGDFRNLGHALLDLGRYDESLSPLQIAARMQPAADTERLLATAELRSGRIDGAEDRFRRLAGGGSPAAEASLGLAEICAIKGDHHAAFAVLDAALKCCPGNPSVRFSFFAAALRIAAFDAIRHAIDAWPESRFDAATENAKVTLATRSGDDALLTEKLLAAELLQERTIWQRDAPVIEGLKTEILSLSDYVHRPYGKSTRNGSQTQIFLSDSVPSLNLLFRTIRDEIEYYMSRLADLGRHDLLPSTRNVHLNAWGVRLRDQGYQTRHFHPLGWVSGVFYVAAPPETGGADGAGCLELPLLGADGMPAWQPRRIAPCPGKLVLFPSHFLHGTIPFHGEAERISIAFDVELEEG